MVYPILVSILGDAFTEGEFTAQTAKQDKVEVGWEGLRLYGNDLDGLGLLGALMRHVGEEGSSPRFVEQANGRGAFFNVPQTRGPFASVQFRSKSNVKYRTPAGLSLVAGRVNVQRRGTNDRGHTPFDVTGNLSLNPTRFFRHSFRRNLSLLNAPSPEMLLTTALSRHTDGEHILDDNDNCILETSKLRHARNAAFVAHRDAYIAYAFIFLRERLSEVNIMPGVSPLMGNVVFNLKRVETYWERACQTPLEYIRIVADRLMSYRSGLRVTSFMQPTAYRRDGNALSVEIPLRDGVALHVYAKTNLRIRYEVRHDLQARALAIGTAHTTGSLTDIPRWLNMLADDAAELLNNVHEFAPPREPPSFELDALQEFVGALNEASDTRDQALRLLSVLVALDSISGKGDDRAALERLKKAGVLVPAGRNMLRIARQFEPVTATLRTRLPEARRSLDLL